MSVGDGSAGDRSAGPARADRAQADQAPDDQAPAGRAPAGRGPAGRAPVGRSRPVLVPRPAGRGDSLVTLLEQRGVAVENRPLTRLVLMSGPEIDLAQERLAAGEYTHLVVTSRTAVEALSPAEAMAEAPVAPPAASPAAPAPSIPSPAGVPPSTQVVAVGEGTAAALAAIGIRADVIASGSGAALVEEMPAASTARTSRVLFPASAAASPTVPEGLRAKGYRVDQVTVYRPEPIDLPEASVQALRTGGYSAIVLTSPMIARRATAIGIHPSTAILTIGNPTSVAVREAGLAVTLQAEGPTDAALADVVVRALDLGP